MSKRRWKLDYETCSYFPRCDLLALQQELESRFKSVKIESFEIYKYTYDNYPIKSYKYKFSEDYILAMGYKGEN